MRPGLQKVSANAEVADIILYIKYMENAYSNAKVKETAYILLKLQKAYTEKNMFNARATR